MTKQDLIQNLKLCKQIISKRDLLRSEREGLQNELNKIRQKPAELSTYVFPFRLMLSFGQVWFLFLDWFLHMFFYSVSSPRIFQHTDSLSLWPLVLFLVLFLVDAGPNAKKRESSKKIKMHWQTGNSSEEQKNPASFSGSMPVQQH